MLSPVFFATRHAWRLWPLAVILAARRQFLLLAAGALVLLAWSTVEWLRRTYSLEGGALRLEEGVLARKLRAVPFDRIQQVDLVRKPLHRLLGVATLRVETAGGGTAAEVDLDVVTLAEAQTLRTSLLRAKARSAAARTGRGTAPPARPVAASKGRGSPAGRARGRGRRGGRRRGRGRRGRGHRGGGRRGAGRAGAAAALARGGDAGRDHGVAGGGRAGRARPLSQAADWFPGLDDWVFQRFDPEAVTPTTPAAFLAVALLAVVVWLGLAAASSIVTDYGFTLARVGDDLVVRRGLLERREAHLPLARLQVVRIEESLLRRALGLASIRIQSAGRTSAADQSAGRLAIPILQRMQVNRVVDELVAGAAPVPRLLAPPPAARRRSVTRSVVRAGLVVAVVALPLWVLAALGVLEVPPALALAALPVLGVAAAVGLAAYRGLGHATGEGSCTPGPGWPSGSSPSSPWPRPRAAASAPPRSSAAPAWPPSTSTSPAAAPPPGPRRVRAPRREPPPGGAGPRVTRTRRVPRWGA